MDSINSTSWIFSSPFASSSNPRINPKTFLKILMRKMAPKMMPTNLISNQLDLKIFWSSWTRSKIKNCSIICSFWLTQVMLEMNLPQTHTMLTNISKISKKLVKQDWSALNLCTLFLCCFTPLLEILLLPLTSWVTQLLQCHLMRTSTCPASSTQASEDKSSKPCW